MKVCHLHFTCKISHNYLQSPVFTILMVLVSKSCKQLQYILKYYICLHTKDSHICETEQQTGILRAHKPTNIPLWCRTGNVQSLDSWIYQTFQSSCNSAETPGQHTGHTACERLVNVAYCQTPRTISLLFLALLLPYVKKKSFTFQAVKWNIQ